MAFKLTAEINAELNTNSVASQLSQMKKILTSNKITVPIKFTVSGTKAATINSINKSFTNLNATLPQTVKNLDSTSRAFSTLRASMSNLGSVSTQLATSNKNVSDAMKITVKSSKQSADALSDVNSRMFEFGRISGLALRRAAGYTIAASALYGLGRAFSSSLKEAISFQNEMVKISQITGQSVSSLSSLKDEVFRLATTFGVSSKEILNAAQVLAQAGLSARDTKLSLQTLAKTSLAATFGDIEENTEGLIAVMKQFNIGSKDIEKAFDAINEVSAKFAVESSDIIAAVKRTGGVFASLSKGVATGQDALNQFIAIFTSIRATTRESAETIATGLRTIFSRIHRPETINLLKAYGIQLQDTEGKFIGLFNAVNVLSSGLANLDKRDIRFSKIVEELGGFRQIGKVIPLLSQTKERLEAYAVAQQSAGSLTEDATKAQESFVVQLTATRERFNKLINDMSDTATFKIITDIFLGLTNQVIKFADALKDVLPLIAALGTARALSNIFSPTGFVRGFGRGLVSTKQAKEGGYIPNLATGGRPTRKRGYIQDGSINEDNVLAYVGRDEYVLPASTVKRVGVDFLDRLRRNEIPGFAAGTDGGTPIFRAGQIPGLTSDTLARTLGKIANSGIELNKQFAKVGEKVGSFDKVIGDVVHRITQNKPKIASVGQLEQYAQRGIQAPSNIDKALLSHLPKDLKVISEAASGIVTTKTSQYGIQKAPSNLVFSTDREQNIQDILNSGGGKAGRSRIKVGTRDAYLDRGVRSRTKASSINFTETGVNINDIGTDFVDRKSRADSLRSLRADMKGLRRYNARKEGRSYLNSPEFLSGNKGLTRNDTLLQQALKGSNAGNTGARDFLLSQGFGAESTSNFIGPLQANPRSLRDQISGIGRNVRGGFRGAISLNRKGNDFLNQDNRRFQGSIAAGAAGAYISNNTNSVSGSAVGGGLTGGALAAGVGAGPAGIAVAATFGALTSAMAKRTEEVMKKAADNLEAGFNALSNAIENNDVKGIKKNFEDVSALIQDQFKAQEFQKQNTFTNQSLRLITGQGLARFGDTPESVRRGSELDSRGKPKRGVFGTKFTADAFNFGLKGAFGLNPEAGISADFVKEDTARIARDNIEKGQQLTNAFSSQKQFVFDKFAKLSNSGNSLDKILGSSVSQKRIFGSQGTTEGKLSSGEIVALAASLADKRGQEALGGAAGNAEQTDIISRDIIREAAKKGGLLDYQKDLDKLNELFKQSSNEVDKFAEDMSNLVALFDRAGTVGDSFRKSNESLTTGFFSQQDNRNVFGNTKAFSLDEIQAEADKIRKTLGQDFTINIDGGKSGTSQIQGNTADEFANALVGVKQLQANLPQVISNINSSIKDVGNESKQSQEGAIFSELDKFKNVPESLRNQIGASLTQEINKRGKQGTLDNVDVNQLLDPIAEAVNGAAKAFVEANNKNIAEYEGSIKEWVSLQQSANKSFQEVTQSRIANENKLKSLQGKDLTIGDQTKGFRSQLLGLSRESGTLGTRPQDFGGRLDRIGILREQLQAASGGDTNAQAFVRANGGANIVGANGSIDQGAVVRALGELKIQEDAANAALQAIATNTDELTAIENESLKIQRTAESARNAASDSTSKGFFGQLQDIQNTQIAQAALKDPKLAQAIGAQGGEQFQKLQAGLGRIQAFDPENKDLQRQIKQITAEANSSSLAGTFDAKRLGLSRQQFVELQTGDTAKQRRLEKDFAAKSAQIEDAGLLISGRAQNKANQFGRNSQNRFESERAAIENPSALAQSFVESLSKVASQLEKVNIPEKIEMKVADVKMNVSITGAEALASMEGKLGELISSKIQSSLSKYINAADGSLQPAPFASGPDKKKALSK